MSIKIEREKFINFVCESKVKDVGTYRRRFRIRRRTPALEASIFSTKSAYLAGNRPVNVPEAIFFDVLSNCTILAEPVDKQGVPNEVDWIEQLLDNAILFALDEEIKKYNKSFMIEVDVDDKPEDRSEAVPVQATEVSAEPTSAPE